MNSSVRYAVKEMMCSLMSLCNAGAGFLRLNPARGLLISCLLFAWVSVNAQNAPVGDTAYRTLSPNESEFDNNSDDYVKEWQTAAPEHEDTTFGNQMYNEPSTPTKLEMLRLLSKETPSSMVFMHAVAMGLGVDEVLQAAVRYEPENGRDLATSAVNILPMVPESGNYLYSSYEIDDLEREDESQPYSVVDVMDRFFKERQVLRPYPDWFDGQYHFLASAAELKQIQASAQEMQWYRSKSKSKAAAKRPIFVSLYEADGSVLIDGKQRVEQALQKDPKARLPVVFIFNRINERSVDELTYIDENDKQGRAYPRTIRGVQDAYTRENLMLTPAPEWQLGEHQLVADIDEFYEVFEIPDEQDFEPEAWDKLLAEAEKYSVNDTSFLITIFGDGRDAISRTRTTSKQDRLYAAWDDPRTEGRFKYVPPMEDDSVIPLKTLIGKGIIVNRPDLIAALKALGVSGVPVAFYYIDDARVKPYSKGPRALIQAAIGAGTPPGNFGDSGGFLPPPVEVPPPASPPGTQ